MQFDSIWFCFMLKLDCKINLYISTLVSSEDNLNNKRVARKVKVQTILTLSLISF
jgi:hypothetical protein